jgi:DNA-binding CsgD family transcriptional regulator
LLVAFFIAYFFNYRNRNRLKQAELQLSNSRLEEELLSASAELQAYIDNMRQTNEAADDLAEKVILTDSHWREFLSKFNQVHPQFLDELLTLNASLTKAERRLCCLTYLSLSDKEMAAMLGVGTNSIRVTRNRVRKKLQIGLEQDLEQLLQAL